MDKGGKGCPGPTWGLPKNNLITNIGQRMAKLLVHQTMWVQIRDMHIAQH